MMTIGLPKNVACKNPKGSQQRLARRHNCVQEMNRSSYAMSGHREGGDRWRCSCGKVFEMWEDEAEGGGWAPLPPSEKLCGSAPRRRYRPETTTEKTMKNTPTNNLPKQNRASKRGGVRSSAWVGADLIRAERRRQIDGEGWGAEHDDQHRSGELCDAAISYAKAAAKQARGESHAYIKEMAAAAAVPWPWEDGWWKPDADQIRNLVKAGALIAAEIDRLHRERTKAPTRWNSATRHE